MMDPLEAVGSPVHPAISDGGAEVLVRDLAKTFASGRAPIVKALDAISLEVHRGEFVVLLGASGCGKTTLLRCLAGLETPDSGSISFADRIVFSKETGTNLNPAARGIGMVFQSYALWPHMTVRENVEFPLKFQKPASKVRGALGVLAVVGCSDLVHRYPHELSGGQQQRVALARALVTNPGLLLFDEPLSNLDAGLRETMRLEIRRIQKEANCPAVYVTHDQREGLALADSLIIMRDGHVLQRGTPKDVYSRPSSVYVAEFLGGANVVPGFGSFSQGIARSAIGEVLVVDSDDPVGLSPFVIVFRAEDVEVQASVEGFGQDITNVFLADVVATEFIGDHLSVELIIGETRLRTRVPNDFPLQQRVHVRLRPDRCRVLPAHGITD